MLTDQQLNDLLLNPETRRKGFEQLVRQYSQQLYWQVRRIVLTHEDADDVVQNALLKAWSSIDTFHGDAKVSTWLTRIAINEALDFQRRQKRRPTMSADDSDLSIANRLLADDYFDGDQADARLQEAIARLPEVQRNVFLLRYYDELKFSEISRITGTTEGALKASYHIAMKKITDYFRQHD